MKTHLAQVREVGDELGVGFLGLGLTPTWTARRHPGDAQGPLRDHARLHAEGRRLRPRHDVPHLHRAGESRLRLRSRHGEEIPRRRSRCSRSRPRCSPIRRSPKASPTAFCRTAPISGPTSTMRAPACCRGCSRSGMGFERYVDYALDVPMYFVYRDDKLYRRRGHVLPRFPRRQELAALPGERPTMSDWADHLTTIFPEVRLKSYLEMRGADGGPWRPSAALPAFWVGLLYDETASTPPGTSSRIGPRKSARRCATTCRASASRRGSGIAICSRSPGIAWRSRMPDCGGAAAPIIPAGTRPAIEPLDRIMDFGRTPAEEMLEKFNGPWHRFSRTGLRGICVLEHDLEKACPRTRMAGPA